MNKQAATQVAWIEAGRLKQQMHVVQKGSQYFAASALDLSRQFSGLVPVRTIKAR